MKTIQCWYCAGFGCDACNQKGIHLFTFYLWYDNGSGYYEGPYPVEAESFEDAINKENLRWCINMYGIGAVVNSELNPNIPENWKNIIIEE